MNDERRMSNDEVRKIPLLRVRRVPGGAGFIFYHRRLLGGHFFLTFTRLKFAGTGWSIDRNHWPPALFICTPFVHIHIQRS